MIKSQSPIGLLGTGIIGSRVAAVLQSKGVPLFLWNRSPRLDSHFLSSPAQVAHSSTILQIFVRDGVALLDVLEQLSPALTTNHLVLNHATVSPEETFQAAALVKKQGAQFLDAPFTGSRDAAAEGKLVYYLGGAQEAIQRAIPILELSSKKILPMGNIGTATYLKIATNLIAGVQVQVLAEALAFLNIHKIPLHYLQEALQYNAAFSTTLGMKLPLMLEGNFEPHFSVKNMLKDLQLALRSLQDHGISLPATAATATALDDLFQSGFGDMDYSALANRYNYPD